MNKIKPAKELFVYFLLLIFVLLITTSCPDEPTEPTENFISVKIFPYVFSNATYTSYINLYNNGQSILEAEITWYDPQGTVVDTEIRMIQPFAIYRFTRPNFTGWVHIQGRGSEKATEAQLEIRENGDNGLSLCSGATVLRQLGVPWFYHMAVTDLGPGQERSTIVTANHNYPSSIYISYCSPHAGCSHYEVEIPPKGLHIFNPMDIWGANFPNGMVDVFFSVTGFSGPNKTGNPIINFTGVIVREIPGEDISILNYRTPGNQWNFTELCNPYLIDVRDNGTTRSDRIYFKNNGSSNYPPPMENFEIHFYDYSGAEVPGSPQTFELVEMFDQLGSHTIISPKELLGQSFSGSIWITPSDNQAAVEVRLLRQWPGKWIDLAEEEYGKPPSFHWEGVIPYVTTSAGPWNYYVAFFYPESIYSVDGTPDIEIDTYGPPGTTPPDPENGVVVLTFRDDAGNDRGWFAFYMNANETRIIEIDQLAETYLGAFTGSICYQPMIHQQLEINHDLNLGHGTAGYLRNGSGSY